MDEKLELSQHYNTSLNAVAVNLNGTCNKRCPYCIAKIPFSTDRILPDHVVVRIYKYFSYIYDIAKQKKYRFMVSGGETGLLPDNILDFVLKDKIDIINTNGTLFKRQGYIKNRENIDKVVYHISPDIKNDMYIQKLEGNIEYQVVLHRKNINILAEFLDLNIHLDFELELNFANYMNNVEYMKLILLRSDVDAIYNILYENISPVIEIKILSEKLN